MVTSPQFVAAVSTKDKQTIVNEIPYYKDILGATVFIVKDESGNVIDGYDEFSGDTKLTNSAMSKISSILSNKNSLPQAHYILNNNELLELFETDLYTYDGLYLGRLVEGTVTSRYLIDDLERLTGFDIIVKYNHRVVAQSNSSLVSNIIDKLPDILESVDPEVGTIKLSGGDALYLMEYDKNLNVSITFLGLPNQQIAPIMSFVKLSYS